MSVKTAPVTFTVAIDGPAAAGKGTIARELARRFGFAYLDTGLLYRATGAKVAEGMDPVTAARTLSDTDLARKDLRTAAAGQAASKVAAMPEVRQALLEFQRVFARREGGAILDGRDIGTVICPGAEVKLYVTANDAVRARRRFLDLLSANPDLTEAEVLADLKARDARDAERDTAPMVAAEDATALDTSRMSVDEAVEAAAKRVESRLLG